MIVLDDQTCPVGMVRNLEQFFAQESCGWCTPCWSGLHWVDADSAGDRGRATGKPGDLERLQLHTQLLGARPHLLRARARRGRAAAERAEVFPRRFRAAHPRAALSRGAVNVMATIYIDNRLRASTTAQNLLHACLSLGFDLPYFCWHPAMGSVGACRQCAVKQFRDENDTPASSSWRA